ncbi:MAG: ABC transporter ATP-binding protein [Anaerolineae bacterium]|nr:ABC transporter ATP-binding protein [Anaerolineae bacterium]
MSAIRLDNVTKLYSRSALMGQTGVRRGLTGDQVDRAFAERVNVRAADESAARAGQGTRIVALEGVNLTIPDGQSFAVVGPSGCGKSTLLRVVAGLEPDFTGRVFYDDQDMRDVEPRDRYIGMVFQTYALYPHFKSKGNLSFFFEIHRIPDQETEERIRITSEMMGIGFNELLKRKPGTLSGGQQQRVAIARAMVRNPRLFLLDEPLSNLDAKLRTQTRVEIKRLLSRFRITTIYVTHDQIEAIALGDQIAVMRAGRIEQVGPYLDLLRDPANSFVAGFLGRPPMNLFTGGVVRDGLLCLQEIVVPLSDAVRSQVSAGRSLAFGVRPEAARLVLDHRALSEGVRTKGIVETVESDFSRRTQLAYVRTGPHFYAASGPLDTLLNVGDEVEVVFPADQLYFFDDQSERRLG